MKYKLIMDTSLLKPSYHETLTKSMLVIDSNNYQLTNIKELLVFICLNYKFAFTLTALHYLQDLYLATEDGFVLPPQAQLQLALEDN